MPFGVDKKLGGDNPSNTKFMEDCVDGISGTNKRTGKPYTKGEKIAICKAQLRKSRASLHGDEMGMEGDKDKMERSMEACMRKAMQSGEAKTMEDAHQICQAKLAKSEFDLEVFEFIFLKDLT